jgi:small subunit ribosomal protein S17
MAKKETKQKVEKTVEEHKVGCSDKNCPIHGNISIRGREFVGELVKLSAQRTGVVQWERLHLIPKYDRYEKRHSKISVHVPVCMGIEVGETVRIAECRPISKTKNFVVIERIK